MTRIYPALSTLLKAVKFVWQMALRKTKAGSTEACVISRIILIPKWLKITSYFS
jgi:hypothetical protein